MDSNQLTPKQREQLKTTIWKYQLFLNRLVDRMNAMSFPKDDPLYVAALKAQAGVNELQDASTELPAWRRAMGNKNTGG